MAFADLADVYGVGVERTQVAVEWVRVGAAGLEDDGLPCCLHFLQHFLECRLQTRVDRRTIEQSLNGLLLLCVVREPEKFIKCEDGIGGLCNQITIQITKPLADINQRISQVIPNSLI